MMINNDNDDNLPLTHHSINHLYYPSLTIFRHNAPPAPQRGHQQVFQVEIRIQCAEVLADRLLAQASLEILVLL
jgi:hypothetical protein